MRRPDDICLDTLHLEDMRCVQKAEAVARIIRRTFALTHCVQKKFALTLCVQ